jgi:hypothetical protein
LAMKSASNPASWMLFRPINSSNLRASMGDRPCEFDIRGSNEESLNSVRSSRESCLRCAKSPWIAMSSGEMAKNN